MPTSNTFAHSALHVTVPPFPTYIMGDRFIFQKGTKHFNRTFEVFDFLYVFSGLLYITENKQKYAIGPGQYLILAPNLEHNGYAPCPAETPIQWFHFQIDHGFTIQDATSAQWSSIIVNENSFIEPARYHFNIPRYGTFKHKERLEAALTRLYELNQQRSPEQALRLQLAFEEFLILLQKDSIDIPSSSEQVTEKIIAYIQENYRSPIQMEDISKALLFHPDYLTRCMKQTIGKSPIDYLYQYRLSLAKHLLATTNEKIANIAARVGIQDSTYFSKIYRKYEGISPNEYRRSSQRNQTSRTVR